MKKRSTPVTPDIVKKVKKLLASIASFAARDNYVKHLKKMRDGKMFDNLINEMTEVEIYLIKLHEFYFSSDAENPLPEKPDIQFHASLSQDN